MRNILALRKAAQRSHELIARLAALDKARTAANTNMNFSEIVNSTKIAGEIMPGTTKVVKALQ